MGVGGIFFPRVAPGVIPSGLDFCGQGMKTMCGGDISLRNDDEVRVGPRSQFFFCRDFLLTGEPDYVK